MTKKKKPRRSRPSQTRAAGSARRPAPPARAKPSTALDPATTDGGSVGSSAGPEDVLQEEALDTTEGDGALEVSATKRPVPPSASARSGDRKRRPREAELERPRGLFGGLRMPSPFPRFGQTMRAGAATIGGSPVLVVFPLLSVLVMWLLLLAVGLDHVPAGLMDILAIPPLSSLFDVNLLLGTVRSPGGTGVAILFGLVFLHAVIWAALVALILEALRGERPSSLTPAAALRALPASVGYLLANIAAFFLVRLVSLFLGSLGSLLSMLGFVGALYFLIFTPIAALNDSVPFREAVRRSVAAARFPGSRHVGLVFLYFFLAFIPLQYSITSPGPFTANPTASQWAFVLVATLVHVMFLAAFAYRYIAVEDQIPAPAPRPARQARLAFRRR